MSIEKTGSKDDCLGEYTSIASVWGENIPPTVLKYAMQTGARELLPNERVAVCLRFHQQRTDTVTVYRSKTAKKAYFGGLMTCGSVWHCPVCAARISEERKQELEYAVNHWTGGLVMVTYTASHRITTPLAEMLDAIKTGMRGFKSGWWFKENARPYGWIGSVRAMEVTYGENGWHPHIHELVFMGNVLADEAFDKLYLAARLHWRDVLGRKGYLASTDRGLHMETATSAIKDYIAKWGHDPSPTNQTVKSGWNVSSEITKQVVKKGKKEGRTASQLLMDYVMGDFGAGELWKEYARVFKGSHQLEWSKGMRALLEMKPEKSDEELGAEIKQDDTVYATITREQWRVILRQERRGEILHNAGRMTQEAFALWFAETFDKVD